LAPALAVELTMPLIAKDTIKGLYAMKRGVAS
jgi:hypothetical protein